MLLASVMAISACRESQSTTPAAQRPVDKATCPEAVLRTDLPVLDRRLVNFGPTILGVEAVFGEGDKRVRVISGGYLDDVFEVYDDLVDVGTTEIRGTEATLYSSSLLGEPVRAAVWRESTETPPCDAHAIIATGLTDAEFEMQVARLE